MVFHSVSDKTFADRFTGEREDTIKIGSDFPTAIVREQRFEFEYSNDNPIGLGVGMEQMPVGIQ